MKNILLFLLLLLISIDMSFASGGNGVALQDQNGTAISSANPLQVTIVGSASGMNLTPNVGIGSTNPGVALDVQGTVRALQYIGTGSGNNTFTGNVGIGTLTPTQIFEISGNGTDIWAQPANGDGGFYNNNGSFYIGVNSNLYNGLLVQNNIIETADGHNKINGAGASFFNGGNVGIGTTLGDALVGIGGGFHAVASTTVGRIICTGLSPLGQACLGYCTSISTDTCACTCG